MKSADTRPARAGRAAATRRGGEKQDFLTGLRRDTLRRWAASALYRYTLIGRTPTDLLVRIGERWPGEVKRGEALLAGNIELRGELVRNPAPVWFPRSAGEEWLAAWHGFTWLPDLMSVGANARDAARALVQSWLRENARWHPVAWRADVLATRLFAWIVHLDEIAGRETDRALRRAILASLAAQLRHLGRTAAWEATGAARLRALKGLVGGLAALGGAEKQLQRALRLFENELPTQVLADGGHRARSPSVQLDVLRDLIDVRTMLRTAQRPVPVPLQDALERMAPMLRFFRHGDRRLALFNDAIEEDAVLVDLVLTRSEAKGRAPMQAPHTGFQRLQAGQCLVLVDTGKPQPGFVEHAHAGTLSFEMSHGRERMIVNCGGFRGTNPTWSRVARASAAHSLLVIEDTNSIEIDEEGALGRVPANVRCERAEEGGHQWISAMHDGYRQRFGLTYAREFYLAGDGDDLRGEDRLTGRSGSRFTVRFHLHPAVTASMVEDSNAALLKLESGAVWRLRAAGAEMSLGESIYLGTGELKTTQQIILSGTTAGNGAVVRWALRREVRGS